jgi:CHAT domain-containing protein
MRPADMHLTPQELQLLLFGVTDSETSIADSAAAQEAQQHLSGCAVCQQVAQKHTNADSLLRGLNLGNKGFRNDLSGNESGNKGTSNRPKRGKDCPGQETWPNLAAGLINEEEATFYVSHAAQCDWCGPLLKESMEDLAQPVTEEEHEALEKLPSASPGWQRAIAEKMAMASGNADTETVAKAEKPAKEKTPKNKEKTGFGWWLKLGWAGSGLAVVIVAVLVGIRLTREPDVNALMAQAYTEQRTIELRIPGAEYGPMKVERGGDERLPEQFHAAEAIIQRESAKHPEDPAWFQAQARADLLQWRFDDASKELDSALMLKPNDPSLLIDKATALYQRALKAGTDRSIDYGDAIEDLDKVLIQNPDDPVALFNRSIIYEKISLNDQAIADLKRYLTVDSSGPWADEARVRLKRLEEKVFNKKQALAQDPVEAAAFTRMAQDSAGVLELNRRIEDYQDRAIKKWLPEAFSADVNPQARREALAALQALGDILSTRHQDKWLNDFLIGDDSDVFVLAVALLRDAVADSDSGKYWYALVDAGKAATLFGQVGNRAGVLRARVEKVHALQRTLKGSDCLALSSNVAASLRGVNYLWIQAQLEIEQSACSIKLGRFEAARSFIWKAQRDTQAGHYPFLQLRSIGIAASIETDAGNLVASWTLNEQGLAKFWETDFAPLMRAHQFYDDLVYPAETLHQWNLALALAEESASTISPTLDRATEAAVRQHLAKLAIRTQDFNLAAEQIQKSTDLYAALPSTEDTKALDAYAGIARAEIDVQEGRFQQADNKLVAVEPKLLNVSDFTIPLAFYQIYGNVLQSQNRPQEAESALERAVSIAEANLKDLHSPKERNIWSQETSPVYRSLVSLELAQGAREKALAVWELYLSAPFRQSGASNPSSKSPEPPLPIPDLRPLRSTLIGQTIVSYALLPDGLAMWSFDDQEMQAQFIKRDPSEISLLVHRFARMCADRDSDISQLRLTAHALYDLFIAPVADRITPSRTLVIELDERLRDIPFQALLGPNDHYLIESVRIAYSPGVIYESRLRPPSVIASTAQVLVVGSSANAGLGFSFVPVNAVGEAADVANMFPHPFLLLGDKATLKNVDARLPSTEVFHFVGHAISDFAREGLVLASSDQTGQAETWGPEQITDGLFTRSKLVVLAACSTGKNYHDRRESHGEFVRTVLAAGVPHVVASRWDVDSEATATFMHHFYVALLSGQSVPAALQVAATDLQSASSTQHPYYWAAFAAFGRA